MMLRRIYHAWLVLTGRAFAVTEVELARAVSRASAEVARLLQAQAADVECQ